MLTKRMAQVCLFAALLAVAALGLARGAHADRLWSTVTVDPQQLVGDYPSIAVGSAGVMVSYYDDENHDLMFAICDPWETGCDETDDWTTLTLDSEGDVGRYTSLVLANTDPIISYYDDTNNAVKFASCDMSESTNGNCDQSGDWTIGTVESNLGDIGAGTSVGYISPFVGISYYDSGTDKYDLKFAICNLPLTNCDAQEEWTKMIVDSAGDVGQYNSGVVDWHGYAMISYYNETNDELKFAICDFDSWCDQGTDWTTMTVDSAGSVGTHTSIALDADGNPMISYREVGDGQLLKFAFCNMSASTHGNCDQPTDWTTPPSAIVTVDDTGNVGGYTSIAVNDYGDPMISYYDYTNLDLKFATCDMAATGCDQTGDWSTQIVDSSLSEEGHTSIAAMSSGNAVIAYPGTLEVTTGDDQCNTTLSADASATDQMIEVADPSGCGINDWIVISGETDECHQIIDLADNELYLSTGLSDDHFIGDSVVEVTECPGWLPAAGTDIFDVEFSATITDDQGENPTAFMATGVARVERGEPYPAEDGPGQCASYEIVSMELEGIFLGHTVEIEAGSWLRPDLPDSTGEICERSPEADIDLDLYMCFDIDGQELCNCRVNPLRPIGYKTPDGEPATEIPPLDQCYELSTVETEFPLCDWSVSETDPVAFVEPAESCSLYTSPPVGGMAEMPPATAGSDLSTDSSSGSGFNYTALGAALGAAAVVAAVAAGAWFARRRWAR
jgi:hypothetical protein